MWNFSDGRMVTPYDLFRTGSEIALMAVEAQSVIALRLMGLSGLWSVTPRESLRMVSEKGPAFRDASMAAVAAAMGGKRPDEIVDAAVKPLRRKTRANVRRLSRRGPKMPSF